MNSTDAVDKATNQIHATVRSARRSAAEAAAKAKHAYAGNADRFSAFANGAKDTLSNVAARTSERARRAWVDGKQAFAGIRESARDVAGQASGKAAQLQKSLVVYVREYPLLSIAAAGIVGLLLSRLVVALTPSRRHSAGSAFGEAATLAAYGAKRAWSDGRKAIDDKREVASAYVDQASAYAEQAARRANEIGTTVSTYVRANPLPALAIASIAGVLLTNVFSSRR